jgi:SAM-dependent methyltransferase
MSIDESAGADEAIIREQIAYYRARAGEYDEWWARTGRFDRGPELNAAWFADIAEVEAALVACMDRELPRTALEFACGTGLFTRFIAPRVARLTAVDASSEVLALNRDRLGVLADAKVAYVEADLFAWIPPARYDLVFMSFWLSHVPDARFDAFWEKVRRALAPGGMAYLIDSAYEPTSSATNHAVPDRTSGVVSRKLNDGRGFRVVKVFHEPDALAQRLANLGLRAVLARTPRYFIHGSLRLA